MAKPPPGIRFIPFSTADAPITVIGSASRVGGCMASPGAGEASRANSGGREPGIQARDRPARQAGAIRAGARAISAGIAVATRTRSSAAVRWYEETLAANAERHGGPDCVAYARRMLLRRGRRSSGFPRL